MNNDKNSDNSKFNIVKARLIEDINSKFIKIFADIINTFYNYFNNLTLNQDNNIIETEHKKIIILNENLDIYKINKNDNCDDIIENNIHNNNIITNKYNNK